jgi:hypothetical protein
MFDTAFRKMGARVRIEASERLVSGVRVDIQRDRRGEFFLLRHPWNTVPDLTVLNVQPRDRHLLLISRVGGEKQKFLCGHDERHWFVAAIPESAAVSNVTQAKAALKPSQVRGQELRAAVRRKDSNRRRNRAFVRQGEWFFVPEPELRVPEMLIMRDEPLVRGRMGKPHFAEHCYRTGGKTVYVSQMAPQGLLEDEYRMRLRDDPKARGVPWRPMRRDPRVYVRGRISHPDHATVVLAEWHRVYMNTETNAKAYAAVVFLD